jgi:uncharacterized protein (TIGR02680 family)
MTLTVSPDARHTAGAKNPGRFRLHRAGILNVWQYDDQEFAFADGRLLLRGANGAGKSKTLEMLLPFAIDGDKARITASAKHHTSLLWLMTDGYEGQARVGYIWVEFLRPTEQGERVFTCGVGIRASASAKTATAWYFATDQRVGRDLLLEDEGGPLSRPRLEEAIGDHGQVFDKAAGYKEHVGRALFGLDAGQYDEVLRLLYWLRQPQVGEDIEPARLADQLSQALPQLDEQAVKAAGDTFDELTAFGEQIARRSAAAEALSVLAGAYVRYARSVVAHRGRAVTAAAQQERRLRADLRSRTEERDALADRSARTQAALDETRARIEDQRGRIAELESGPEARDQKRLGELAELAAQRERIAAQIEVRADRSQQAYDGRARSQATERDSIVQRLSAHAGELRRLDARLAELGVEAAVAAPVVDGAGLGDVEAARRSADALEEAAERLRASGSAVGRRQAAVGLVVEALARFSEARRAADNAQERAEECERAWEAARDRRGEAERSADDVADDLFGRLAAWAAEPAAPPLALPDVLTPESVPTLARLARAAADPVSGRLRGEAQREATQADNARARTVELEQRRQEIEAETDPAPPAPSLPRSERPDGAGLWRLVDFRADLSTEHRAGVEAALQASGLLDAWVRPDGRVLDADARDVLLVPGSTVVSGPTLADVLVPDSPDAGDIPAATVTAVLRGIALADSADRGGHEVAVGADGSWRLAGLRGRAAKPRAQFLGASARAQERARRLAEVDNELESQRTLLTSARERLAVLEGQIAELEAWLRARPAADALIAAWTRVEERREAEVVAEAVNAAAQRRAQEARDAGARRRKELHDLATTHRLPVEAGQVEAIAERLRTLDLDVRDAGNAGGSLRRELERWIRDEQALDEAALTLEADRQQAGEARAEADRAASVLAEMRENVGASVAALQTRLDALRRQLAEAADARDRHDRELRDLTGQAGRAEERVQQAEAALTSHHAERGEVLGGFAAVAGVPGLLEAAFHEAEAPEPAHLLAGPQVPDHESLPRQVVEVARSCSALVAEADEVDTTVVWRGYTDMTSGPGGDHDPRVSEFGDLLAVTGRDDAGEAPIIELSARVTSAVEADRTLLTQREKERFEQHVLGELGDAIRQCRIEADELVDAMNRLLSGVTTSQGIRVRLDWRLRDDVPAEAQGAIRLLAQPVGALLPHERAELRDALHRLIEASRAERPELAYGEHLAAALDYRTWFSFRIRYTRPETPGEWSSLHRRSALSQGEQKVLCYLPLFAAAAAHFTSLAGAAPHAPRLVLLDDAFPKIDVRTHPLLFGLMVDLDLDFVITSERLWGDHETVPSLAIYETLRDPSQRGIAQFEYRWDGRQLRSLG